MTRPSIRPPIPTRPSIRCPVPARPLPTPLKGLISNYEAETHTLGSMTEQCSIYSALHWKAEAKQGPILYTTCCSKGDGLLPPPPEPPQLLRELLQGDTQRSRHFLRYIRGYNNALTFTSYKYQQDTRLQGRAGIQSFTIHGELYHLQGPLHTGAQAIPSFAQLYFYDPAAAATSRLCHHPDLWQPLLQDLDDMVRSCGNPFINMYATAREQIERARALTGPMQIVLNPRLQLVMEAGSDKRRINLPIALEVAAFIPDEYEDRSFRDIVIAERCEDGEEPCFYTINHSNAAYFPLYYVLLFPQGNVGWHWSLRLRNNNNTRIIVRYSERAWLRYHLFSRPDQYSAILRAGSLFQQYIVDCYAVIDQQTLDFHHRHQDIIRSDLYQGVHDAVLAGDSCADTLGRRTILPSSFGGGDRSMAQKCQDSLAIQ